ncbi:MAG: NifB/NifX family molybdenum-iron cluster-binding protein [Sphaerochaetaceae bacterium]|jgi:predicted Fe-Mo cluster-binding NifX family protein
MKRIAVAVDKDVVSAHFGLCEKFLVYETDGDKIHKIEKIKNPGHKPCTLPKFIKEIGADLLITGNMGKTAASNCVLLHIPYIIGAEGEARAAVSNYLCGNLESQGELCDAWTCEFFDQSNH